MFPQTWIFRRLISVESKEEAIYRDSPVYIYVAGAKLSTRHPASTKAANRRSLVVLDTDCNKNICQMNPVILLKTLKVHSIWLKSPLRTTKRRHYAIRPFSSCLKPLFDAEASRKTIDMEMIFFCKWMETNILPKFLASRNEITQLRKTTTLLVLKTCFGCFNIHH